MDYWGRSGEDLNKLLQKGMRVRIEGELRMDVWEDKNNPGQMVSGMAVTASLISILPQRLESVALKARQQYAPQNNPSEYPDSES